jgi:hypothetical protein
MGSGTKRGIPLSYCQLPEEKRMGALYRYSAATCSHQSIAKKVIIILEKTKNIFFLKDDARLVVLRSCSFEDLMIPT